jgi:hypothetical protein
MLRKRSVGHEGAGNYITPYITRIHTVKDNMEAV